MLKQVITFISIAAAGLSGCSAIEKDEYKEAEESDTKTTSDDDTTDPAPVDPITDTETEVDPDVFGTGLASCVKTAIEQDNKAIFVAPDLAETLDEVNVAGLATDLDTWTNLVDHLLREVVTPTTGLVDYSRLSGDLQPLWDKITTSLEAMDPPGVSTAENDRIAYWTNVYNIVMMDLVVEHDLKDVSTKFDVFDQNKPFGTYKLNLNQIEKGILGMGGRTETFPSELQVDTIEPRLHFALVCAALSCPRLRNFAYRGDQLDEILNENTLMFFNSTTHIDSSVKVSNLFAWYAVDFDLLAKGTDGTARKGLAEATVIDECRDDSAAIGTAFESTAWTDLPIITYDWTVNTQ